METRTCNTCGRPLTETDQSTCPSCLMRIGVDVPTLAADLHRFDLPTPEELNDAIPRLEVIDLIAHGGMGAVYKARQTDLDRVVAIKVLPAELSRDTDFVQRFQQEARTLARLNHAHIVTVHDSGIAGGWCYIVMEYIHGFTLREAIHSGKFSPEQAIDIVPHLCDALRTAHGQGIVHRDIKPENILLSAEGDVKIADFGIAKLLDDDQTHYNAGTRKYMAPEQQTGATDIDHRADIYSLGVVFYELLTGQTPGDQFVPPSQSAQIDQRIDSVVRKTLQKRPELRYQEVHEIAKELERLRMADMHRSPSGQIFVLANTGMQWQSEARIFGYPVIDFASGVDPTTGKKRVAKGLIAAGDAAIGGLAFGGFAMGLVAAGGCGLGVIALGGLGAGLLLGIGGGAVGAIAMGGGSVGGIATGGGAVGGIAVGGGSYGYAAIGGGASGKYTADHRGLTPESWFDSPLGEFIRNDLPNLVTILPIAMVVTIVGLIILTAIIRCATYKPSPNDPPPIRTVDSMPVTYMFGVVVGTLGIVLGTVIASIYHATLLSQILERIT